MNYKEALLYLNRSVNYERISDYNYKDAYKLKRIRRLLSLLDDPQDKYLSVIISGTKGKGSTVAMTGSILTLAGIRTGIYTSPHLISIRERIKIGTHRISRKEFSTGLSLIKRIIDKNRLKGLTFFEILTALAFLYFAKKRIDMAVLEVGLGGRLDATNVINPLVCAITPISYDHIHLLGNTIKEIAREKCGIIKEGSLAVSGPQLSQAQEVIKNRCSANNAELMLVGKDIKYNNVRISFNGTSFGIKTRYSCYKNLNTPLIGRHQAINSATALGIIEILKRDFDITKQAIRDGLKNVNFAGRFQIASKRPYVILDGAHNRASAEVLKDTVRELFGKRRILLILGISYDKDIIGIGKTLCPIAEQVIFTRSATPRASEPKELARGLAKFCKDYHVAYDTKDAVIFAKEFACKEDVILITGSLFLVGEALRILK